MAINRKLITIEELNIDRFELEEFHEILGVATNASEAYKIVLLHMEMKKDGSNMKISGGINNERAGNYHRFLQSISTEGKVDIITRRSILDFRYRCTMILSNQLITNNQKPESCQKSKTKKKAAKKARRK